MTNEAIAGEAGATAPGEATRSAEPWWRKKFVLFIALALLVALGAGSAAYFSGVADALLGTSPSDPAHATPASAAFFDLPEMVVNLNSGGRKSTFLKLSVSLEIADDHQIKQLERVLPRIVDSFQVYLRGLRIEDLSGSAGLQRLREELLLRVNTVAHPAIVNDVLFKEMLVQ